MLYTLALYVFAQSEHSGILALPSSAPTALVLAFPLLWPSWLFWPCPAQPLRLCSCIPFALAILAVLVCLAQSLGCVLAFLCSGHSTVTVTSEESSQYYSAVSDDFFDVYSD
jgi:hypothetical protein